MSGITIKDAGEQYTQEDNDNGEDIGNANSASVQTVYPSLNSKKVKSEDEVDADTLCYNVFGDGLNPFELAPVIGILMARMDIEDLKTARCVCEKWNQVSTRELIKLKSQIGLQKVSSDQLPKVTKLFDESRLMPLITDKIEITLKNMSTSVSKFLTLFDPKFISIEIGQQDTSTEGTDMYVRLLENLQITRKYVQRLKIYGQLQINGLGDYIDWPDSVQFPELREFEVGNIENNLLPFDEIQYVIKEIICNSSKLDSLSFTDQPYNYPMNEMFGSKEIIEKIRNLKLSYAKYQDTALTFSRDLLDLSISGLKLTRFSITLSFQGKYVILGHLERLRDFLASQATTLVELSLSIEFEEHDIGRLTIPYLPMLQVIKLGLHGDCDFIPFNPIDIPIVLPRLSELIIGVNTDLMKFKNLFKGISESVKTVQINHLDLKSYSKIRYLESILPNVDELKIDHIWHNYSYDERWNKEYKIIPWSNTLVKLALFSPNIEIVEFGSFAHLNGLRHIELIRNRISLEDVPIEKSFDLVGLAKTGIKSIKIKNYTFDRQLLEEIQSLYELIYIPRTDRDTN